MTVASRTTDLGLTCPSGGSFHVCQKAITPFIGCCAIDPCSDGNGDCPQEYLRYSSYSKDSYVNIPAESCVSPYNSSSWYTCSNADPPFLGCCASNPCNAGCSTDDLLAARLSDDPSDASVFLTPTASAAAATSAASGDHGSTSLSTGAIVGIAIGSALGALIGAVALFFCYKRREKAKKDRLVAVGQPSPSGTPGTYLPSPYQDSFASPGFSPPVPYAQAVQQYGNEKLGGIAMASDQTLFQRPPSSSPSWVSGYGPSAGQASVSSEGSRTWGLQPQQPQHLHPVSEMGDTEVSRPVPELPGSGPQCPVQEYKPGYERVATSVDDG